MRTTLMGLVWLAMTIDVCVVAAADNGAVSRGKYLVEEIARCPTCHTPRDEQDRPDENRPLAGSPVPYLPAHRIAPGPD